MSNTSSHLHSSNVKHGLQARIPAIVGIILAILTGDAIQPLAILLILVSLYYLISGLVRRDLATPLHIGIYVVIVSIFSVLGVVALSTEQPWSYYAVALGWLLHAVWDVYHFRKNTVVPKWVSEFCFVYDTLMAVMLIVLANR